MRTFCRFLLVGVALAFVVGCGKKNQDKNSSSGGSVTRSTSVESRQAIPPARHGIRIAGSPFPSTT